MNLKYLNSYKNSFELLLLCGKKNNDVAFKMEINF